MRPVEFHSRRRVARRSNSHRSSHASRVTGRHAQESLSPRFRLSGRVIVGVTSRGGRIRVSPTRAFVRVRVYLRTADCFNGISMPLEFELVRKEGRLDCSPCYSRHATRCLLLIDPVDWSDVVDGSATLFPHPSISSASGSRCTGVKGRGARPQLVSAGGVGNGSNVRLRRSEFAVVLTRAQVRRRLDRRIRRGDDTGKARDCWIVCSDFV